MPDYDVIVIGAGLGGLTSGALLAKQGRSVLVLEQSDLIGGCCSTFEKDGYHFDIGASIVEGIGNIQHAFEMLDSDFEKEVPLLPCDPIYSCLLRSGEKITFHQSLSATAEEIAAVSPQDGRNFYRFCEAFKAYFDGGGDDYFITPVNSLGDMIELVRKRPVMTRFLPYFISSYQDVLDKFFVDDRIKQCMAYQSFYAGHPPDLTPGIFAIIPYMEHLGMFYPKGGMISIPEGLARRGKHFGMELRLKTPVAKVLVDGNRRARGVRLADGTTITSKIVVSNVNAKTLYLDMIGPEHLPWLTYNGVKSYELSLTSPMIYLGVDYKPDLGAHHTIVPLPVSEMDDTWWNIYRQGRIPSEQFGLICSPTLADPSLAPAGHHILNLILMGPYHLAASTWDQEKPRFIEQVIKWLDGSFLPGLAKHVKMAEMSTPLDYERRLRLPGGAIYGLQQDLPAQAVFRPAGKSKAIGGLYLTGASTHPGGGVPTTVASGIIAAKQIARYER